MGKKFNQVCMYAYRLELSTVHMTTATSKGGMYSATIFWPSGVNNLSRESGVRYTQHMNSSWHLVYTTQQTILSLYQVCLSMTNSFPSHEPVERTREMHTTSYELFVAFSLYHYLRTNHFIIVPALWMTN